MQPEIVTAFSITRKHKVEGDNREKIRQAFTETLQRCVRLEEAEELENAVHLNGDEILFFINNRHIAPNTQEMFDAIQPDLTAVLEQMYGGDGFTVELAFEDIRERFAVQISAHSGKGVADLLANLEND